MQSAFWIARNVEVRSLAGLSLILLFFFANDSSATGDADQMLTQEKASKDVVARQAAAPPAWFSLWIMARERRPRPG